MTAVEKGFDDLKNTVTRLEEFFGLPRRGRPFWARLVGYVLLAGAVHAAGSYFFGAGLRKAEAAEVAAEASWKTAEAMGEAARRSRARALFVSDSLQGVAATHREAARSAAVRARTANLALEAQELSFREVLAPEQQAGFDSIVVAHAEVVEEFEVALAESAAEAFALGQTIRTLETQLQVEVDLQAALRIAIGDSQAEAERWKSAAQPGFLRDLWGDLPKLAGAVVVGFVANSMAGG